MIDALNAYRGIPGLSEKTRGRCCSRQVKQERSSGKHTANYCLLFFDCLVKVSRWRSAQRRPSYLIERPDAIAKPTCRNHQGVNEQDHCCDFLVKAKLDVVVDSLTQTAAPDQTQYRGYAQVCFPSQQGVIE